MFPFILPHEQNLVHAKPYKLNFSVKGTIQFQIWSKCRAKDTTFNVEKWLIRKPDWHDGNEKLAKYKILLSFILVINQLYAQNFVLQ